jgi:hypothetical protein
VPNFFLATSLWFGLIHVLDDHHDKIVTFVTKEIESTLVLCSDSVQRKSLNEVINSQCLTAWNTFLRCTFSKQAFCLKEVFGVELIIVVKMAHLVANFVALLDVFTLVKDWTKLESSSYSTIPFFESLKWFGALETKIGFENTLCIIASLAKRPRE